MHLWKKLRIPLLAVNFGGVLFVLVRTILAPTGSSRAVTSFVFPSVVPLPEWQPLASRPLDDPDDPNDKWQNSLAGRHYRYIQNGLPLDIEMRYMHTTDGDTRDFIRNYTSIPSEAVLHQQKGVGFYGLLAYQRRVYLSACINPRGGSTVTETQFQQNQYTSDVRFSRLLPWLLGRENLRHNRCLWALLSIPLKNSSPNNAYPILENAWFSWYQWWSPRLTKR
jgi:cyanosortase A-associated protein